MGVEPGRPSGPRDKAKSLWRWRRSVPRQLHLGLGHPPRASVSPSAQLGSACLPGWAAPTRGPSAGPTLGSPAQKRRKETRPQPRFPSPPPRDLGLWGAPFETPCKGRRNCGVGAPTPHSTLPAAHPPNPRCRCGMALPVSVAGAPVTIGVPRPRAGGHRNSSWRERGVSPPPRLCISWRRVTRTWVPAPPQHCLLRPQGAEGGARAQGQ